MVHDILKKIVSRMKALATRNDKVILKSTNRRELFNIALINVIAQGRPALGKSGCEYQSRLAYNNAHCGVGWLFTDSFLKDLGYNNDRINTIILDVRSHPDKKWREASDIIGSDIMELLIALQSAHDESAHASRDVRDSNLQEGNAYFIELFKIQMGKVAKRFFDIEPNTYNFKVGIPLK